MPKTCSRTLSYKKETTESLLARLESAWERLVGLGFNEKTILAQSIITPSCGFGSSSKQAATEAFRLTKQLSEHIRTKFHLD